MHSYLRMQAERRFLRSRHQTSICSGLYWHLPTDGAAPRGPHQRLMSGRGTSATGKQGRRGLQGGPQTAPDDSGSQARQTSGGLIPRRDDRSVGKVRKLTGLQDYMG